MKTNLIKIIIALFATLGAVGCQIFDGGNPDTSFGENFKDGEIRNIKTEFYQRPGLESLRKINYSKLPIQNIAQLGAKGDGVQDAAQFFSLAIKNLVKKGGGIIYIPAGTYCFYPPKVPENSFWAPDKVWQSFSGATPNNVHFVGEGSRSVIKFLRPVKNDSKAIWGWSFNTSTNISIRDLSFTWFPYEIKSETSEFNGGSICFKNSDQVTLTKIHCSQGPGGIHIESNRGPCHVVDCEISDCSGAAFRFVKTCNARILYNHVSNPGSDAFSFIEAENTGKNILLGNKVIGGGSGSGASISGSNILIQANHFERCGGSGIHLQTEESEELKGFLISKNRIIRTNLNKSGKKRRNKGGGISVLGNFTGIKIAQNDIFGNSGDGVLCSDSENAATMKSLALTSNKIEGNMGYGIAIDLINPHSKLNGALLISNLSQNNQVGDVLLSGKLENINSSENIVSKAPRLKDCSIKKIDGFKFKSIKSNYHDTYLLLRKTPPSPKWNEAPELTFSILPKISINSFINPKGANAKGNENATVMLNKALHSLPSYGGTIVFPAGDYYFKPIHNNTSTVLSMLKYHVTLHKRRNVQFLGKGSKTRLFFTGEDHRGLGFLGISNLQIKNLELHCLNQKRHIKNKTLLEISGCENVILTDLKVINRAGSGIKIDASSNVLIKNCEIRDSGSSGLALSACRQVRIQKNRIASPTTNAIEVNCVGSIFRNPDHIKIDGNIIEQCESGAGILVSSGEQVVITKNKISNCYLPAVAISQSNITFPPRNVDIIANTIQSCGTGKSNYLLGAIAITACSEGEFIIAGNNISSSPLNGIWIDGNPKLRILVLRNNKFQKINGQNIFCRPEQSKNIKQFMK